VERTLLSVAFDFGSDFDFDFDFLSSKTPRVPHPCAFSAQGWEPQTPAAPVLTLMLPLALHVWSGHSCPLPLTLILTSFGKGTTSVVPNCDIYIV
jgi:hypothetical protein